MPRITPTTTWNERTWKSTTWQQPRWIDCLTWDEAVFSWNEAVFSWDSTCDWLITIWWEPRTGFFIEDLTKTNIVDLSWEPVLWISWNSTNKIDTDWQ